MAASLQKDGPKLDTNLTLGELVQGRWHSEHFLGCKPSSQRTYRSLLRSQLLPAFGSFKLAEIDRPAIAKWFDAFSQHAPGNANRGLILLAQILGFAVRHGLLTHNPAAGLPKNKPRKVMRFLSTEEIARLHEVMDQPTQSATSRIRGRDIVRLLILTGCRKSEILHLRWDEVEGDKLRLKDSKIGPREVQLPPQAQVILAQQSRGSSPFVFPSNVNPSRPITCIDSFWYEVRGAAGLSDVRLHDLRHNFASHAVMNWVPLPVLAKLLGHSRIAMTMRYAHVGDKTIEAAA